MYVLTTCDYFELFECIKLLPTSKRSVFNVGKKNLMYVHITITILNPCTHYM